MTIAVPSDIHLGDDGCKLVVENETTPPTRRFATAFAPAPAARRSLPHPQRRHHGFRRGLVRQGLRARQNALQSLARDGSPTRSLIPETTTKHVWMPSNGEVYVIRRLKSSEDKDPRPVRPRSRVMTLRSHRRSRFQGDHAGAPDVYGTLFLEGLSSPSASYPSMSSIQPVIRAESDTLS